MLCIFVKLIYYYNNTAMMLSFLLQAYMKHFCSLLIHVSYYITFNFNILTKTFSFIPSLICHKICNSDIIFFVSFQTQFYLTRLNLQFQKDIIDLKVPYKIMLYIWPNLGNNFLKFLLPVL